MSNEVPCYICIKYLGTCTTGKSHIPICPNCARDFHLEINLEVNTIEPEPSREDDRIIDGG
jgi:hypothetical protein